MDAELRQFHEEIDMAIAELPEGDELYPSHINWTLRSNIISYLTTHLVPRGYRVIKPDNSQLHFLILIETKRTGIVHVVDSDDQIVNLSPYYADQWSHIAVMDHFGKAMRYMQLVLDAGHLVGMS